MQYKNPIIIAEIGCNHKGDLKTAKKMIQTAAMCGVKYAKFQKRDNKYLLGNKFNLPHPVQENSYGKTYGLHREFLEFNFNILVTKKKAAYQSKRPNIYSHFTLFTTNEGV